MKTKYLKLAAIPGGILPFINAPAVHAHCPLCTAGAGAMAGAAALFGIKYGAIGVFIGGFAAALGLWVIRIVKKQYIPYQKPLIFLAVYFSTVIPLVPFTKDHSSVYLSVSGDYGSVFNRTYLINWFVIGIVLGGVIVYLAPFLSSKLTQMRHQKKIKLQGIILTLLLLLTVALPIQFLR